LTEKVLDQIRLEVDAEIEEAVEFARSSPDVEPEAAFEGVYA
jgi:TPP-dependent pyruvate/acetoin dehydrogenase alpha subunit